MPLRLEVIPELGAPLQYVHLLATIWQHQVDMTDTKGGGDLEQRGYCWIATASFKPT